MRPRPVLGVLVALVCALPVAGCRDGADETATPGPSASPAPTDVEAPSLPAAPSATATPAAGLPPASAAGGVCVRIRFDEVARTVGVPFAVAGASGTPGRTQACVLQQVGATVPDLTYTVGPAESSLTPADYTADYVPSGAATLRGLGRAGYSRVSAAAAGAGPRVEIGWLGTDRLSMLVLTTAPGTSTAVARQYVQRLAVLGARLSA